MFGLVVPVASLADVIRSKQAANRAKDQRVLPTLREILASRFDRPRLIDSPPGRHVPSTHHVDDRLT